MEDAGVELEDAVKVEGAVGEEPEDGEFALRGKGVHGEVGPECRGDFGIHGREGRRRNDE
jgi:hypothetical protein